MSINLRRLLSGRLDKPHMSGKYASLFDVEILRSGACNLSVRRAQAARVHRWGITCVLSCHLKTTKIGG